MKKTFFLIVIVLAGKITALAQQPSLPFFQKLFIDLKNKDSVDFFKNHLSAEQYLRLLRIVQPALTDSSAELIGIKKFFDQHSHELVSKDFRKIIYQADTLGIDPSILDYADCKFEEVKDPKSYCRSARGIIYFKWKGNDFEWVITEAIWIDNEWKILSEGQLFKGNAVGFPPAKADAISSFGSSSKVKVTKVVLSPPPPNTQKPPPPPPPEPPKTKHQPNDLQKRQLR